VILAEHPPITQEVDRAVQQANTKPPRVEQVKNYKIFPEFWEPGSAVPTPTLELRRRPIAEKYATTIEAPST
jgi:long-subunit acyl-CoA synthetase (AMP-forming)